MAPASRKENDTRPRFEVYPNNSPILETVVVEDFPFIIGRGEGTHLRINSSSVSREHAQLTRTSAGYRLRDLGSMNGTAINGQPVSDSSLKDGDTVSIAETELIFVCSSSGNLERMATQPLADNRKTNPNTETVSKITASRVLSESLLWQAIPLSRTGIIDRESGLEQATLVSVDEPLASRLHASDAHDSCSTISRIQQLAWQLTAEHADKISAAGAILMRVELQASFDDRLCHALDQAFEILSSEQSLGIILPWEWAVQSPATLKLCAELKSLGAELAFDYFSGNAESIDAMEVASPDFLLIAPTLARGISSYPRRLEQLNKILSNCEAVDIQCVLPVGLAEEDYQAGADLGVNLIMSTSSSPAGVERIKPIAVEV